MERCIKDKKLSKVNASFAIYQIAEGMKFIHFNRIIHCDIKPSNILVSSDGTIKICDTGITKLKTPDDQAISFNCDVNSLYFTAPEILNNK